MNNRKEKKTEQLSQLMEKKDWQNPIPIHDLKNKNKNTQQTRERRELPQ